MDECSAIINITRSVKTLINRLSRIKQGNENSILEIVSINKLMHDVKIDTISERKRKLILPFEFNYWFIYNLFNHSKYTFVKIRNIIQFGFEIPLYQKKQLAKIYTKPVIIDNVPYRYRLNAMYTSPDGIFYTEGARKENCFYSENLKKLFCKPPTTVEQCDYNHHSLIEIHENKCFEKLPINNYLVHIGNNLYFTIIKTLAINISCANESKKSLVLSGASNILNAQNCSLKTRTFNLKMINKTEYIAYTIPNRNYEIPTIGIIFVTFLGMGVIVWTMAAIYVFCLSSIYCHTQEHQSNTYIPSSVIKNH